jgi:hypothetical protein
MWDMRLFDNIARDYHGPARFVASEFAFLNQSGRGVFQDARDLLESWFDDYPASDKKDLRSQFRSPRNRQHWAAFFELYCHALLRHQSFGIELHPSGGAGKTTRPDFLISRDGEKVFYMECTLAADSVFDDAAQKRLDQVIDSLNESLDSPNFFINVQVKDAPPHSPSISRIRQFLEDHLRGLDPDEVAEVMRARRLEDYDRWSYKDSGWEAVFSPVPIALEFRGRPGARPIGAVFYEARVINPERALLTSLSKKAKRYGVLDLPYVIAADTMDVHTEEEDVGDALFGRKVVHFNKEMDQVSFVHSNSNALWIDPEGPRYRRVSAVFIARGLRASTIKTVETPVLWHNPWANIPLDPKLWQGPQKVPELATSTMRDREGRDFSEILGLNLEYPA